MNTGSYYNWLNGRGNNTGFHSGMMLPGGINEAQFEGRWRLQDVGSVINKAGLTADWYRYSMVITATTFQIKLLNLRTNVLLEGNIKNIGTADNADTFNYTFFSYGISGVSGAYGSIGINMSNIKIKRSSVTVLHIPLSEGYLAVIRDVVNKTAYNMGFFTISSGWAKLADFSHYNFKNGYTLYTKLSNPSIYVPNDSTGAEIPWTPLLSYVKGANHGSCLLEHNQCESKFKLDDVSVDDLYKPFVANSGVTGMDGFYSYVADNEGLPYYDNASGFRLVYSGGYWWLATVPFVAIFRCVPLGYPVPYGISYMDAVSGEPVVLTITNELFASASPLYTADVDHYLFADGTGVANEFDVKEVDVTTGFNRGFMYINPNANEHNFMLYGNDKTLASDVKVIKYIGLADEIVYDEETGEIVYDENDHAVLV